MMKNLRLGFLFFIILNFTLSGFPANEYKKIYRIGVLAERGKQNCFKRWKHTARYLDYHVHGVAFDIVPLEYDEVANQVSLSNLDFLIVDPALFVYLENKFGIENLATLKNRVGSITTTYLGSVVFSKRDRKDIKDIDDFRDKKIVAISDKSFSGWLIFLSELRNHIINPNNYFAKVGFLEIYDSVVYAVNSGEFDLGVVRTDTLEKMESEGKILKDDFKIFDVRRDKNNRNNNFPFMSSTNLYPEWVFAKLKNTDRNISERVVQELLAMGIDEMATVVGDYGGWTVSLSYQPVHEVLMKLRFPPYENYGRITIKGIIKQYFGWIVFTLFLLVILIFFLVYVSILNFHVTRAKQSLEKEVIQRKKAEENLRTTKHLDDLIYKTVPSAIFTVDTQKRITTWNNKAEEITGYSREEVVGKECIFLNQTSCCNNCDIENKDIIRPIIKDECFITRKDGKHRIIVKISDILKDADGNIIGEIEVFQDVTEQKKLSRDLLSQNRYIEILSRM